MNMHLGMIGLGRMGAGIAQRLMRGGHLVVGYDLNAESRQNFSNTGGEAVDSLAALVSKMPTPRTLWLMLPAGDVTQNVMTELLPLLSEDDVVVDGGNANYKDTLRRASAFTAQRTHLVDCGTSGGIWGLEEGYSLMIGGDAAIIERLRPLFECLAPAPDKGWARVGPIGAGHFTKMVHNGIEYGLMQSLAEGFSILQHKQEFDFDLHQVAEVWRYGSVVRSWLLDLTAAALRDNPSMQGIAPYVQDSGEGRWAVAEALELDVFAPIITLSLLGRLRSRDPDAFSDKLLAAMRNAFGGHAIIKDAIIKQ